MATSGEAWPRRPGATVAARVTPELGAHRAAELRPAGRGRVEARRSGAGPADAGMLYVEGTPVTVPVVAEYVEDSPFVLRAARTTGWAVYRDGERLAARRPRAAAPVLRPRRPPTASPTGRSRCCTWTRWPARCCRPAPTGATTTSARSAASASLDAGPHDRRRRRPSHARRGGGRRQGARRRGRRDADHRQHARPRPRRAVRRPVRRRRSRRRPGCRCRCSSSRPPTSTCIDRVADLGIDSVGIHVETFDPAVLARVAPGKAALGHRGLLPAPGSGRSRPSARARSRPT